MKAIFLGYQEDENGNYFALYNVPCRGSYTTVGLQGVLDRGFEVPETPTLKEYQGKEG